MCICRPGKETNEFEYITVMRSAADDSHDTLGSVVTYYLHFLGGHLAGASEVNSGSSDASVRQQMPALFEEHDAPLSDVDDLFLSSLRGRIDSEQVVSSQEMSHRLIGSIVDLDEDAAGHLGEDPPQPDMGPLLLIIHGSAR